MSITCHQLQPLLSKHADIIQQLGRLYEEMDASYTKMAEHHEFECRGCEDNCCLTRFYHHTLVEIAGLYSGYIKLPEERRQRIFQRAQEYCQILDQSEGSDRPMRHLCPLNEETLCLLYRQRPMICRLHGIPHMMRHPAKGLIAGGGCHIFEHHRTHEGHALDRTPIYTAMAQLEKKLRQASKITTPLRMTVAQMIVCFEVLQPSPGKCGDTLSEKSGTSTA